MDEPAKPSPGEIENLLKKVVEGAGTKGPPPPQPPSQEASEAPEGDKLPLKTFGEAADPKSEANIELLRDVTLRLRVEVGRARMFVRDILKLGPGSVVELERLTGDPLDLYVNDRLVARGEVLVVNENFAVRIRELVDPTRVAEAEKGT